MTDIVWTDRSRIETYQRCPRLRWLEYHQDSRGIAPAKKSLPLCVGGAVHKGLETLLRSHGTMAHLDWRANVPASDAEEAAVRAALADFATHRSALALDDTEAAALSTVDPASLHAQMLATATDLGMPLDDPALVALSQQQRNAAAEFDAWLYAEQSALVEGMVRAYARRRLRPLLEEFEVLEVEQEGDWELGETQLTVGHVDPDGVCLNCGQDTRLRHNPICPRMTQAVPIRFMSRPDALLRNRSDNSLYLLSYKTAATWDVRKARDAEHDMQGLSEGVEVERRLGEWWDRLHNGAEDDVPTKDVRMLNFLASLPAPPRILGIRYEYLLKGYRSQDRDLSARFGINVWSQRSHLIQRYVATSTPSRGVAAYRVGDQCWSYDYHKDDGSTSKLAWQNWRREPVWEHGTVRDWIDALDQTTETMSAYDSTTGAEPRSLGYSGPAQALGYTATHPLDEIFPAPMTVYRSDDQLRDWVEQVEAQERRVAEAVAVVESSADEGERRHGLNVYFPMARRACSYPVECTMVKVCYGGDDIRANPLASGLYKVRECNHRQEREAVASAAGESHD